MINCAALPTTNWLMRKWLTESSIMTTVISGCNEGMGGNAGRHSSQAWFDLVSDIWDKLKYFGKQHGPVIVC